MDESKTYLLLSALAVMLLVPLEASANLAAAKIFPAATSSANALTATSLQVSEEVLTLSCAEEASGPVCRFEAVYTVHNPTDSREQTLVAFLGGALEEVAITWQGQPADYPLTPADLVGLSKQTPWVHAPENPSLMHDLMVWGESPARNYRLTQHGARFELEGGATGKLVSRGVMKPSQEAVLPSYALPPIVARHSLLNQYRPDRRYSFDYLLGPLKSWGHVGGVTVSVSFPEAWQFEGQLLSVSKIDSSDRHVLSLSHTEDRDWAISTEAGVTSATLTDLTREGAQDIDDLLALSFVLPASLLSFGGLSAGVGGVMGDSEPGGVRLRLGLEGGLSEGLLLRLDADSDASSLLVLTPTLTAATEQFLILPSFGLGLGAPVMLAPTRAVGVRVLADFQMLWLGTALSVDFYPGLEHDDVSRWQVSWLGILSL